MSGCIYESGWDDLSFSELWLLFVSHVPKTPHLKVFSISQVSQFLCIPKENKKKKKTQLLNQFDITIQILLV